jgi:cobalt-zinc-cadmium efflux system protein
VTHEHHDHSHSAGHHHDHARSLGPGREKRLATAIALNVAIVVAQIVAGVAAGSLGLLADAAHNLTDVLAITVSLIAVRLTRRPLTRQRSFGFHRATVLAALFNAASILAVCVFVLVEAAQRLRNPEPVEGGIVVAFAALGAVCNGVAALVVADRSNDVNMRGAMLHLTSDAITSVAVAVCGAIMLMTGSWYWLDPAIALVISVLIAWQGWKLAKSAMEILLESTPDGLDPDEVAVAIAAVEGVDAVHDLHAWSLSSEMRALSAHIVVSGHPTLEDAQVVAGRVKRALAVDFGIAHATIELECEPCAPDPICDAEPVASAHDHR